MVAAQEEFLVEMMMASYIHNEYFQSLRKTNKLQHGENLSGIVVLLLSDFL